MLELLLVEEACRSADRLDKLDALLRGDVDVWARLVHDLRTEDYELRINGAAAEARQLASTLRQLVSALQVPAAQPAGAMPGSLTGATPEDGDDVDELAAARAARRKAASPGS